VFDFRGLSGHAGTTPMDARRDAGLAAAVFAVAVNALVGRDFPGCVATVCDMRFESGGFNVVPDAARVSLELRSPEAAEIDALEAALHREARAAAERHALGVEGATVGRWEPATLDPGVREVIAGAAAGLDLTAIEVPSGAGHDAQALAAVTPSGMIFVPSAGGVSHQPGERTSWEDCLNGANTLLHAALELCRLYALRGA
jgi:N-carbamoyl-L-amino-acid hydrolase